jgi:predicted transposase YdaD
LTLIGQTRIEEPGRVLPQVLKIIGQTSDVKERSRLFAALTSLMRDEEILKMAEKLAEAMDRGLMMDTPLLRRIREEGQVEGQAKGQAEGLLEAILDVIAARLDLSVPVYRGLERRLSTISDVERLRGLLQAAIQASDVADFERALDQ